MSPGQNASAGRSRIVLSVILVVVLAVAAAAGTVAVSAATHSPDGDRVLSPKIQVAAGSEHVDDEAGIVVRVPEGWRAGSGELVFGSTGLVPEVEESAQGGDGIVLVGELTPELRAAQEADNQRAAAVLVSGMGEFFLPIPGERTEHRMEEVSTRLGDGWALSYRVVPAGAVGGPGGGLVYTAVVGPGHGDGSDKRYWLTYVGAPADGSMTSPGPEWADEVVERLRPAG